MNALTTEQHSRLMAKIRGKDTLPGMPESKIELKDFALSCDEEGRNTKGGELTQLGVTTRLSSMKKRMTMIATKFTLLFNATLSNKVQVASAITLTWRLDGIMAYGSFLRFNRQIRSRSRNLIVEKIGDQVFQDFICAILHDVQIRAWFYDSTVDWPNRVGIGFNAVVRDSQGGN